jgi:aminoglycoside phosphotransferase (APT) family kinase protein
VTVSPVPGSPHHGFVDDEPTRLLLRSRPPAAALDWVGRAMGGVVTTARALQGGTSSAMHTLAVRRHDGVEHVVLRRYVRPEVNAEEPDIAAREARTLRLVAGLALPTPQLLAVDDTGAAAGGVPAVLMSRLPGRLDWTPSDVDNWLQRMAALLPVIHAAPRPPAGAVQPFAGYRQESYERPSWARRPSMWQRAVDIFHGPRLDTTDAFTHRDFHPGNLLWEGDAVTGVVDWTSASIGPPSVDVANCRMNLLRTAGTDRADAFTRRWERLSGLEFHPYADVMVIVGCLDMLREDPPRNRFVVEEALGRAVAALRGDAG